MSRVRLTQRKAKAKEVAAAADKTPYPGSVNQPDRQDPEYGEYDNYVEYPGWELQNLNPDWKNDGRDGIGFPVREAPTNPALSVANVKQAASKAVKLAVLLLGDKSPESEIEAQAKTFMRLGMKGLDASLVRYAGTEEFYVAEEVTEEVEEIVEASEECVGDDCAEIEAAIEIAAEEEVEETVEATEIEVVQDSAEELAPTDEPAVEEVIGIKAGEEVVEIEEEGVIEPTASASAELDIEMNPMMDDAEATEEESVMLSSLYADDVMIEEVEACDDSADIQIEEVGMRKASRKGVQKLGGQPKVASNVKELDLSGLWKNDPDVSDVFNQ